ncbi:MAG: hypothetical protein A2857_04095 [Candidatus Levybacteria bacterium RIFCSPHIGHO2_01_FULL_36_15]|nr:MAG: hypothetical protein A2857_04095 [Candidatus Levybacteria bacterium RIFCSPHIGHO2_01_FULL_36_15]OGH37435.1 MAG: hypothetical protein A2905_04860 [Candidatus Levybacteria bacterium RIFCSPLOWO2_01_FULL_36_10]
MSYLIILIIVLVVSPLILSEVKGLSFASAGMVFLVLAGSVVGLAFINKDKNLLKRYSFSKGFSFIPVLIIIAAITLVVILDLQRENSIILNQLAEIGSTKISRGLAIENVKKLPEVQEYLKNVPNGKIEVDNESEGEYNVHVYEIKDRHTATFNWYTVSIKSGEAQKGL